MTAKSYLGNSLLKASGVPLNFTKDQIEEYLKCADDPIYFIESYCKIVVNSKNDLYNNIDTINYLSIEYDYIIFSI